MDQHRDSSCEDLKPATAKWWEEAMKSKGKVHVRFEDQPKVPILASVFTSSVMLGKFLDLSEFCHL